MDAHDERRAYQRLNLMRPLDGWFGDYAVRLLDVSASGALVDLEEPLEEHARALLRFFWNGEEVEVTAEVARADEKRLGLKFVEENETLRRLIATSVTEILAAQQANADGHREANVIGDGTLTSASEHFGDARTFTVWMYADGRWKHRRSLLPDQPADGFTIAANEPEEQVAMLCRTYENGDEEARRLTRLLAELSVTRVSS
ncbi:MAG TPA: PilZ domain-containing protein [Thermoanaerobaculia bacterium]|nr:PilZ domain-containing protein [Thermoanaerobaculia bacterium]